MEIYSTILKVKYMYMGSMKLDKVTNFVPKKLHNIMQIHNSVMWDWQYST